MDNAVALVQAYLRLHGYFTVTEFPIIEGRGEAGFRSATDLDILGIRFAHAGHQIVGGRGPSDMSGSDPVLAIPRAGADMIIGEVKEGVATLNAAAADPAVVEAALVRFGCCQPNTAADTVRRLQHDAVALLPNGHQVRILAFGSTQGSSSIPFHFVPLDRVVGYLQRFVSTHFDALRTMNPKDPAFGFLLTLEKARRGRHEASTLSDNDLSR